MKQLFLPFALLPILATAQQIRPNVRAGAALYMARNSTSIFMAIRGQAEWRHFTLGGGLDMTFGSERVSFDYYDAMSRQEKLFRAKHTTYGISPNVFVNYKKHVRHGYFYAGVSTGIYYYPVTEYIKAMASKQIFFIKSIEYKTNAVFGPQVGYSTFLTPSIGVSCEVAYRHVYNTDKNISYIPMSIGVGYRPAFKKKNDVKK